MYNCSTDGQVAKSSQMDTHSRSVKGQAEEWMAYYAHTNEMLQHNSQWIRKWRNWVSYYMCIYTYMYIHVNRQSTRNYAWLLSISCGTMMDIHSPMTADHLVNSTHCNRYLSTDIIYMYSTCCKNNLLYHSTCCNQSITVL